MPDLSETPTAQLAETVRRGLVLPECTNRDCHGEHPHLDALDVLQARAEQADRLRDALRAEFLRTLPDLDYEVAPSEWENPHWAWMDHPWRELVGLTDDEIYAALAASA